MPDPATPIHSLLLLHSKQFQRFMYYSSLGTGYMATIQSTSGIPLHYAQAPESMLRQNINHPISYQNKTRDFSNTTITQIERKTKNLPNKGSPILLPLRDILPSYFNRGYQTIVSSKAIASEFRSLGRGVGFEVAETFPCC